VVRRAKKGEKFLGLDGVEYALDEKTLVIADAERPIAMAGVIGGKLTEITSSTKNILLESAYFDPLAVRQAARRHKVSTDSSYRFERGVTPSGVFAASDRAAGLITGAMLCGGRATGENAVRSGKFETPKKVTLQISKIKESLGLDMKALRAASILKNLGFGVKTTAAAITATPPDFRRDVSRDADLLEEILRVEGFDKVKPSVPVTRHAHSSFGDGKATRLLELKKYLAALGLHEIMTYSLLSGKALEDSGLAGVAHKVVNASSGEQEFFRPSLLPGALGAVLFNANRKASSILFFEIGNRYHKGEERTALGLTFYGQAEDNWRRKSETDFFDVKGAVENVLTYLKTVPFEWTGETCEGPMDDQAMLRVGGEHAGIAGTVSRAILKKWGIEKPVYYAEIDLDTVFSKPASPVRVQPVSKYPAVRRDVAFVSDRSVSVAALEGAMTEAAAPHLKEVCLFDQYAGKNIPPGKRSLAFSLWYHKDSGTFNEDEILDLQKRVGQTLTVRFGVEFRQ
jgi:phenylalanyl-tRNA synthetase beta chain